MGKDEVAAAVGESKTPAAPEGETRKSLPGASLPPGAALPPIPAPPAKDVRPGGKRGPGRPPGSKNATPPAVGTKPAEGAAPSAVVSPAAPVGPPPWRDPAVMAEARDSACGLVILLHIRFSSQGGIGFDAETGAQFVEGVAPAMAKYSLSGYAPEIAAGLALFALIPWARQSADAFDAKIKSSGGKWDGPLHPRELAMALQVPSKAEKKPG